MSERIRGTKDFTPITTWEAQGAHVGLATCLRCGAAVLVDPRDKTEESGTALHLRWHEEGTHEQQ